jgi:hypothetical protein
MAALGRPFRACGGVRACSRGGAPGWFWPGRWPLGEEVFFTKRRARVGGPLALGKEETTWWRVGIPLGWRHWAAPSGLVVGCGRVPGAVPRAGLARAVGPWERRYSSRSAGRVSAGRWPLGKEETTWWRVGIPFGWRHWAAPSGLVVGCGCVPGAVPRAGFGRAVGPWVGGGVATFSGCKSSEHGIGSSVRWFFRPEGANQDSPGQRPGEEEIEHSQALKGRSIRCHNPSPACTSTLSSAPKIGSHS